MSWGTTQGRNQSMDPTRLFQSFKKIDILSLFSMKIHPCDNLVAMFNFSLFSKILLMEAIVVTCKDFFAEEISCNFNPIPNFNSENIKEYCWMEGIHIMLSGSSRSPYTGVTSSVPNDNGSKFHLRYYKWVYSALLIQSIMFFSLKWVWNRLLDHRLTDIVDKLKKDKKNLYEYNEADRLNIVQTIADLLFSYGSFYSSVIFIEIFCLVHLIFQIWATDRFLNGNFLKLGIVWLDSSYNIKSITSMLSTSSVPIEFPSTAGGSSFSNSYDPLQYIFPRMVKCTLQFFGPSGETNSYDGLCFLPANVLHEKVFLILWFIYSFMLIFIILTLIYRGLVLMLPPLRYFMLSFTCSSFAAKSYRRLLNSPSSWFLLNILSTTIPTSHFIDLMDKVLESHFDKHGKPRNNSKLGEYAKENKAINVNRILNDCEINEGGAVQEDVQWSKEWDNNDHDSPEKSSDVSHPSTSDAV